MKTYLSRTWIDPRLVPGESAIHGVGVFASAPIGRGEKLMEFGGLVTPRQEALTERYRVRSLWLVNDDVFLALPQSDPRPSLDENLNHSCDANSWLADEVNLLARTDIPAGAEITLDQGTWNFEEGDYIVDQDACSCGSPHCRGVVGGNDWKLPEVRRRYGDHFHPLILKRIEACHPA